MKSLYAEHKLLCFIPASKNKQEGIKAIIETWGQRCDKLLFFFGGDKLIESEINSKVNFVTLPMSQGTDAYEKLWEKVTLALEYIYEKYIDEFDWVLKADDNTYIVMENLRLFIRGKGLRLEYYGHKVWNSKYYNQGGAGYLMSQLVIKRLIENGFNKSCYPRDLGFRTYEDLWIGHCFSSVNVVMGNSLDNLGRHMFIPLSLELYLNPSKNQELFDLYQRYAVDPIRKVNNYFKERVEGILTLYAFE